MTRTLVTGGAGFIGGAVVRHLLARGEAVRILDTRPGPPGVDGVTGSILDPRALEAAMAGIDAVIHCAAIARLWTPDRGGFARVNVAGTAAVLGAVAAARVRMVHVSSFTTLVGGPRRDAPHDETVELDPAALLGPYPRSKRAGELAALDAAAAGADVVIALPSAPIGPGDRGATAPMALLRDVARGALPGYLDGPINLVDLGALAGGLVAARDRGVAGRRYLLAGEDLPMADVLGRIAAAAGTAPPGWRVPAALALAVARADAMRAALTRRPPRAPLTGVRIALRQPRFDAARARAELGFAPPPVDAAIADAVAWLRAQGVLGTPPG